MLVGENSHQLYAKMLFIIKLSKTLDRPPKGNTQESDFLTPAYGFVFIVLVSLGRIIFTGTASKL